jgi:hypothetical protein
VIDNTARGVGCLQQPNDVGINLSLRHLSHYPSAN